MGVNLKPYSVETNEETASVVYVNSKGEESIIEVSPITNKDTIEYITDLLNVAFVKGINLGMTTTINEIQNRCLSGEKIE